MKKCFAIFFCLMYAVFCSSTPVVSSLIDRVQTSSSNESQQEGKTEDRAERMSLQEHCSRPEEDALTKRLSRRTVKPEAVQQCSIVALYPRSGTVLANQSPLFLLHGRFRL